MINTEELLRLFCSRKPTCQGAVKLVDGMKLNVNNDGTLSLTVLERQV